MDQREEIKSKIDIVELVGQHVPLKKAGRNYKGLCPFHSEKTPSFMVSQELQIYKCFGCGKGGDIFSFLMDIEGMDFAESLKTLAERTGVKLTSFKPSPAQAEKEALLSATHLVSQFYHYILTHHDRGEPGRNFLKSRGISSRSIKDFLLGFAPDSPTLLEKNLVQKKKLDSSSLAKAGISYLDRRHNLVDRFSGRIIFPLFDHRSQIVGLAGRLLPGDTRDAGKYINTPETSIYHKSQLLYAFHITRSHITRAQKAVVVEGELDAISSYQTGINNVVAIKGTALTGEQSRLLSRSSSEVILALDSDPAGIEAAWRGIAQAQVVGLTVKIADLTPFKDPDEAAQKDPEKYKNRLIKAQPVFDFYLTSLKRKFADEPEADRKRLIARAFLSKLTQEPDEIIRFHYIKKLAQTLEVSEESVANQLSRIHQPSSVAPPSPPPPPSSGSRQEMLETHLLKIIFQEKPDLIQTVDRNLFSHVGHLRLFNLAKAHYAKHHTLYPQELLKLLPEEVRDLFSSLLLDQLQQELHSDPHHLDLEVDRTIKLLTQIVAKTQMTSLAAKLKSAQGASQKQLEQDLKEQLTAATKKISESRLE